ncbi:hypothetical protein HYV89_05220 [Candidatus Woesearchaeota archaeon]|nr:hypothetical protein [Candidatus Woesearchaeota archaeon]
MRSGDNLEASTFGKRVKGVVAVVAGTVIAGSVLCHYVTKESAVKDVKISAVKEAREVKSGLEKKLTIAESANIVLKNENKTLESDKELLSGRVTLLQTEADSARKEADKRAVAIKALEKKAQVSYQDSIRVVYQKQYSKHPSEIRDFAYKSEFEGRKAYLYIEQVKEKSLKEIIEEVIPENLKERKEFAVSIPGFFDRYQALAKKYKLSTSLTDYTAIDATKQMSGVWNIVFIDKNGKEKLAEYYPGRD